MIKKNLLMIFPLMLLFTFLIKADVPPDAGNVRVRLDLVLETTEDLADYKFFLNFYGDLKEIEVKDKGRTTIQPMGGGARYGGATLLAIPKKSLSDAGKNLTSEQLEVLAQAIKDNKIEGVIELLSHRFTRDIPSGQKPEKVYYRIEREKNLLKATKISEDQTPSNPTTEVSGAVNSRIALVVSGISVTLAVLIVGLLAFRKVSKKV